MKHNPIICAVDTCNIQEAKQIIKEVHLYVGMIKLGLEFFVRNGIGGVKDILDEFDAKVFLDLKLHDTPNTVKKTLIGLSCLHVDMITVHIAGGEDMLNAATYVLSETPRNTSIDVIGVRALTSKPKSSDESLPTLPKAKLQGIVCPADEVKYLKSIDKNDLTFICPGIRPSWYHQKDDQIRTATPKEAIDAGADYIVIGRPITEARDRVKAVKDILNEIGYKVNTN